MPDWFSNDNGQVISEDTKRREVMKSIIRSKNPRHELFDQGRSGLQLSIEHSFQ